jgi:hypothetical protein
LIQSPSDYIGLGEERQFAGVDRCIHALAPCVFG